MKKTFLFIMALVAIVFMTTSMESCTKCVRSNDGFGFVYTATVDGEADGDVLLTFPNGKFTANGDAALGFVYSNDTVAVFGVPALTTADVLADPEADPELKAFAEAVESDFANQFNATSASGTYYLKLKAVVHEKATGMELNFEKVFTNRADSVAVVAE